MPVECRSVHGKLSPYLEGELNPPDKETVATHVATCPACSSELLRLRGLLAQLKGLASPPVPPGFRSEVWERIDAAGWGARLKEWLLDPWYVKVPVGALATAAVALLICQVVLIIQPPGKPDPALQEPLYSRSQTFAEGPPKAVPAAPLLERKKASAFAQGPAAGRPISLRLSVADLEKGREGVESALAKIRPVHTQSLAPTLYSLTLTERQYSKLRSRLSTLGQLRDVPLAAIPPDLLRGASVEELREAPSGSYWVILELVPGDSSRQP